MSQNIKFTAIVLTIFGVAALCVGLPHAASTEPQPSLFYSEWSKPVLVPELKVSAADYPTALSQDGLSLYFYRVNANTREDIYVVHRANTASGWGTPVKLPAEINTNASDYAAFITLDGRSLYFASDRAGGKGGADLYVSRRTNTDDDNAWEPPVNLAEVNSPGLDVGPFLFENEETGEKQLYFASAPFPGGALAAADIYLSVLGPNGFGTPTPVVELSSPGGDNRPCLRRDGREFYLQTNRSGVPSVYVARRASTDQPWSTPVVAIAPSDLGDPTVSFVLTPVISWDAQTLFVGIWKNGIDNGDIYVAQREMVTPVNACFRSPQSYLVNLLSVNASVGRTAVYLGGVNYNRPVVVGYNLGLLRAVLQGNAFPGLPPATPFARLNQEFLAAQLSVALAGGTAVLNGQLQCYRNLGFFPPVVLSNGAKLTPYSTLGDLLEQARLALAENRTADLDALAGLLDQLNGNDPSGVCQQ